MLTVKKSNHRIRSRDLLLTLMCYAFMCSGNLRSYWEQQIHVVIGRENYDETGSVESVRIICLTDVLTALLFYDFLLSFILTGYDGCSESDSLYNCTGEEKPIERCKTRFKVAEENKLFSSFRKKDIIEFNWSQRDARKMVSQAIQTC